MTLATKEKASDNTNDNNKSYERQRRRQRKLQMCSLMAEEAAVLSLDSGRSCTRKQQQ